MSVIRSSPSSSDSIGPLLAGMMRRFLGANMLYAFVCACAVILSWRVQPWRVSHLHAVAGAPLHHVAMPDSTSSSPLTAALDPRVDERMVRDQMVDEPTQAVQAEQQFGQEQQEGGHSADCEERNPAAR